MSLIQPLPIRSSLPGASSTFVAFSNLLAACVISVRSNGSVSGSTHDHFSPGSCALMPSTYCRGSPLIIVGHDAHSSQNFCRRGRRAGAVQADARRRDDLPMDTGQGRSGHWPRATLADCQASVPIAASNVSSISWAACLTAPETLVGSNGATYPAGGV